MNKLFKGFGVCAAALSLALFAALLPAAAFADESDAETTAAVTNEAEETAAKSAAIEGKVKSVTEKDGGAVITLDNGKDGIVLNISELRFVYDSKAKAYASLADVKEGMTLASIGPANAPLTQSSPPQIGTVFGLILNSDASRYELDVFDADLLSGRGQLKLNIGENTVIGKDTGEKRVFTADDLKNQELIVFYDVVATSQPAQTTPTFVLILSPAPETAPVESEPEPTAAEVTYVGLRAAVEAKGYTVTWVSNKQPITLTKGDVTATVTIGTDAFTYTHLTKDVQPLDSVEKLDLATQLFDGKTMVASTFVDLLK